MPPAPATLPSPPPPARFCGAAVATSGNLQLCDRVDDEVIGSTPTNGGMGSRDWSLIPADLLDLIASKSTDIEDYVRFRTVCKPWRSATNPTNPKLPPSLPWLLACNPDDPFRRFYSLSRRKFYTIHLPETLHHYLWGTSHGCLLMADSSFSLSLLNPLARSLIHLPAVTSFPRTSHYQFLRTGDALFLQFNDDPYQTLMTLMHIYNYLNCYVFTFGENDCLVVVSVDDSPQLLYCKVGGTGTATAWTMLHSLSEDSVASVAYHNRRFYALYTNSDVVFWDVGSTRTEGVFVEFPLGMVPRFTPKGSYGMVAYGGELIVVVSIRKRVSFDVENDDKVLAVEFVTGKLTENGWSNLEDIGNFCMFMAFNSEDQIMMGVGGDCVAEWRRNSIYAADVYKDDWLETFPLHQICVVSMQEKAFTLSKLLISSDEVFPPMWIIPSLLC